MKTSIDKTAGRGHHLSLPKRQHDTRGTRSIRDNRPATRYQRQLQETMNSHVAAKTIPPQQKASKHALHRTPTLQPITTTTSSEAPVQCYNDSNEFEDNRVIGHLREMGVVHRKQSGAHEWSQEADRLNEQQKRAIETLDSSVFGKTDAHEVWGERLSVSVFIKEAMERIEKPERINQSETQTCGVVVVNYLMAMHQPVKYIENMAELYFEGTLDGKPVKERQTVFKRSSGLSLFDWLHIVPFRHQENKLFSYHGESGNNWNAWMRAFTTPIFVKKWMKRELGATDTKIRYPIGTNVSEKLIALKDRLENGRTVVVLLVNSFLLPDHEYESKPFFNRPNHYVVLHSIESDENGTLTMQVYTWGKMELIRMDKRKLRKFVWGIIEGTLSEA
ncbi:MAG: hypothetical protein AAF551_03045 [Bacteroidota bacterium]